MYYWHEQKVWLCLTTIWEQVIGIKLVILRYFFGISQSRVVVEKLLTGSKRLTHYHITEVKNI